MPSWLDSLLPSNLINARHNKAITRSIDWLSRTERLREGWPSAHTCANADACCAFLVVQFEKSGRTQMTSFSKDFRGFPLPHQYFYGNASHSRRALLPIRFKTWCSRSHVSTPARKSRPCGHKCSTSNSARSRGITTIRTRRRRQPHWGARTSPRHQHTARNDSCN